MKIGLALSGGGTRAIVFHLGMLKALAEKGYWPSIHYISSVSGGSLCVALIMANNDYKWPTQDEYVNVVLPKIEHLLTLSKWTSLQVLLCLPFILFLLLYTIVLYLVGFKWFWPMTVGCFVLAAMIPKAYYLSFLLRSVWKINCDISLLPRIPQWAINCTCWDTGKNWRFEQRRMGDYKTNYVKNPTFPLSHAIVASAAFPWAIGALRIKTTGYNWTDRNGKSCEPVSEKLALWDGGIYDNLGLESLFKLDYKKEPKTYIQQHCDFLIVSDASAKLLVEQRKYLFSMPIPTFLRSRIAEITTDQVRSLRARQMFNYFKANMNGLYICMGEAEKNTGKCNNYNHIISIKTSLMNFSDDDYNILFNHAYDLTIHRIDEHYNGCILQSVS